MKRFLDIIFSAILLILAAPILLAVALIVRMGLGRPVFFIQMRPGLYGHPFRMIKFRTMREAVDASGKSLADAERLTPLERFLRSTSLDELPII